MIFGIGIDAVEIERIQKQLVKNRERFYKSLFTEREIQYCLKKTSNNAQAQCFAGRFAAKEAFLKAIGIGLRNGLNWKDIEIFNDDLGKPNLLLKEKTMKTVEKAAISNIQLSLSHGRNIATAVVILEK
jgi:holo-[acyl-carrier protein] synthase